jgi:serine/threonine protein kinase
MTGEAFSYFRILSRLGTGGMGEVYLAADTRLGRKVALKVLPLGFAADEGACRRFAQEARAASALNHPNIVTIYDIGSEGGRDFIAMEHVDGESLRCVLSTRGLGLKLAVEMIAQAASALAAAHEAGIVHRDIKPENLMLAGPLGRPSHLKVLDFGLAKLIETRRASLLSSEVTTLTGAQAPVGDTRPGAIVGTVAYMSPEQAEGRELDHRTDIFSLGLVLYEVFTGRPAFRGNSTIDTLHAIVHDDPVPATGLNSRLPPEAAEILAKAIAKDPAERYRHAGDFELDLRRLKRALDSNALPGMRSKVVVGPQSRARKALLTVTAAAAICAAFLAGWRLNRVAVPTGAGAELAQVTLTPLTSDPGLELDPTFSPDGETIAYSSDRTGNFEIFLKQVSGAADINLTNNPADDIQPSFSPDGKQIAFVSSRAGSPDILDYGLQTRFMGGSIWVMSALGGTPRRIASSGSFPSWSPDGSRILYSNGTWFHSKLYTVTAAGGEPAEIPVRFAAAQEFVTWPRFSADGRWIIFEGSGDRIYVVPSEGGAPRPVAHGRRPLWAAGSRTIIYSDAQPGRNFSLWQVPFSITKGQVSGAASPLTIGRGWDLPGSVSPDGKRIALSTSEETFNLEVLPFDAEGGRVTGTPRPITTGNQRISFFSFSPDSRSTVYNSVRGAENHIWRAGLGSAPVQLTADPNFLDGSPRWSPDGRTIAFARTRTDQLERSAGSWLMAADGANPQPLLESIGFGGQGGVAVGRWLPDGSGLVYRRMRERQLYIFDLASKKSRPITYGRGWCDADSECQPGRQVGRVSVHDGGHRGYPRNTGHGWAVESCSRHAPPGLPPVVFAIGPLALLSPRPQESLARARSRAGMAPSPAGEDHKFPRIGLALAGRFARFSRWPATRLRQRTHHRRHLASNAREIKQLKVVCGLTVTNVGS